MSKKLSTINVSLAISFILHACKKEDVSVEVYGGNLACDPRADADCSDRFLGPDKKDFILSVDGELRQTRSFSLAWGQVKRARSYTLKIGSDEGCTLNTEVFSEIPETAVTLSLERPAKYYACLYAHVGKASRFVPSPSNPFPLSIAPIIPREVPSNPVFQDQDFHLNTLGGAVSFDRASSETDITAYHLFLGSDDKTIKGEELARVEKSDAALSFTIPSGTDSTGASHLLVFSGFEGNLSLTAASLAFTDIVGPFLDAIGNQTIDEGVALVSIDAGDKGDDLTDVAAAITYTCLYDAVQDGGVSATDPCTNLTGLSFDTSTGVLAWTPNYNQAGTYEMKITGSDSSLSHSMVFAITVNNALAIPANLTATPDIGINTLTWDPVTNATSYRIYWATTPGQGRSGTAIDGVSSPYVHSSLSSGTTYYYTVTAVEGSTESDLSSEVESTPYVSLASLSNTNALSRSPSRKTFYDTVNQQHWAFYYDGSEIAYARSADGITWISVGTLAQNTSEFHVGFRELSGTGYVYIAYETSAANIEFRRGTLSSSGVTFGAVVHPFNKGVNASYRYQRPYFTFTDSNVIWMAVSLFDGDAIQVQAKYSLNAASGDLTNWSTAQNIGDRSLVTKTPILMSRGGSDLYLAYADGPNVISYEYTAATWTKATAQSSDYGWTHIWGPSHLDNGEVRVTKIHDGKLFIGGSFQNAGGNSAADGIAFWDGTAWNAVANGVNGSVYAINFIGQDLYIGGTFTDAGGDGNADYVALWRGETWEALGTGLNSPVLALANIGSDLYVGGQFFNAAGIDEGDYIAKWNGSAWSALSTGLNFRVYALLVQGSNLYVGGSFTDAGGDAAADYAAIWNGSTWAAVGAGLTGQVSSMAFDDSARLVVGGTFVDASANGSADRIAYWDSGASLWKNLGTGANGEVRSISLDGSDLYIGGSFSLASGVASTSYVAKWDGTTWAAISSGVGNTVYSVYASAGLLYVGGVYTNAGSIASADRLALWDGSTWSGLGAEISTAINAVASSGSKTYIGGSFSSAGGNSNANAIAYFENGAWGNILTGLNGDVHAIAIDGSDLYVGGAFTDAGSASGDRITKWDGTVWQSLGSGLNGTVRAIVVAGTKVYVGGDFTDAGGIGAADGIAYYESGSWNALGTGSVGTVRSIAVSGTKVLIGGDFTSVGGVGSTAKIALWSGAAWTALSTGLNGNVYAVGISGTDYYAGGDFTDAGGNGSADRIAYHNGSWQPLGTGANSTVRSLALSGSSLFIGGDFTQVNSNSEIQYVAQYSSSTWAKVGRGVNKAINSVEAISATKLFAGGSGGSFSLYDQVAKNQVISFDAVSDTNHDIQLVYNANSGLKAKVWNSSTDWTAESTISSRGGLPSLSLLSDGSELSVFFVSAGKLKYSESNLSTWSATPTLIPSSTVVNTACDLAGLAGSLKCVWVVGGPTAPFPLLTRIFNP